MNDNNPPAFEGCKQLGMREKKSKELTSLVQRVNSDFVYDNLSWIPSKQKNPNQNPRELMGGLKEIIDIELRVLFM